MTLEQQAWAWSVAAIVGIALFGVFTAVCGPL